jgi:hypothetical protein
MKTSLVIIDGAVQVVLTPETAFEKRIIEEIMARIQPDDTPDDHEDKSLVITIGEVEV